MAKERSEAPLPGGPIKTRLARPDGRVSLLPRPTLLDRLITEGARVRVVLICAGPGYGKTELAGAVHRAIEAGEGEPRAEPCWYTLDESDRDPAVFLTYLAAALESPCPELPRAVDDVLRSIPGESALTAGLSEVVNRIFDHRPHEVVLVLDDLHHVSEAPPLRHALEWLLRHQPPNLRLVVCTRRRPEIESLSRLRAAGQVLDIDDSHLRLGRDETERLFGEVYELPLDEATLDLLQSRTDGWMAGLQLFQQYLRRRGEAASDPAIEELGGTADLFEYLGREVLASEGEEVKDLLVRSSILDELSGPLCDAMLDRSGSADLLEEIHRRRLFLLPLDASREWYRVHPLFREFLRRRLDAAEEKAAIRVLHAEAAGWLREGGRLEEAVDHYLAADHFESAADLVVDLGPMLLRAGRFGHLDGWLERLPERVADERPWVWLLRARLAHFRGVASLAPLDRALARFEALGDETGISAARRGKAGALFRLGRYTETIEIANEVLEGLAPEQNTERAEVFMLLSDCASETADLHGAERYLDRALVLHQETGDADEQARVLHKLASVYVLRGRFRSSLTADRRALELTHGANDPLRAAIYVTLGWAHHLLGDHDRALEELKELKDLCARLDLHLPRCYALCLEGDILLERGDLEAAWEFYAQAQGLGQQLGEPSMRIEPWLGLARARRAEGRYGEAREAAERALGLAKDIGYGWFIGRALGELGATHLAAGDAAAGALLAEAGSALEALDSRYELAVCRLRQAWLRRQEEDEAFLEPLESCLLLAQAEGYDHLLLRREAPIAVPLLVDAVAADLQTEYVSRLLGDSGRIELLRPLLEDRSPALRWRAIGVVRRIGGRQALMALSSMRGDKDRDVRQAAGAAVEFLTSEGPATLRVLTLGGFEVWRGDDQIVASEWGGRRTKDLFKLFVIHRHEPVVRDVIIETLWPDFALETALNNLNVTVSTLRRVLEPWLAPREPSSYIFSEDGSHRLNASELDLDVDRFTELGRRTLELVSARRWQETVQTGAAAAATYRGEFLPENRYDDWTTIERERLSHLYGQVLFATARGWAGVGRLEEACRVCRELLHLDPFGEEVHRSLMRYLALLGRRAEALHQFEECRRSLEGDLGVAVSGETLELHRRIQAGEPV